MKEQTKLLQQKLSCVYERTHLTARELAEIIITHLIFTFCGFFASRGLVQNKFLPFGASLVAGSPQQIMFSVFIGSLAGSIFPASNSGGFRYISALLQFLQYGFWLLK